ncbi:hypothetical protein [Phytoactinopolyspora halophila]|uniref:hypothetical protein n=1 Tax=Phytoactinopolyspora halophila TaxID=1981511 RepID=UPI000F4D91CA|nr:hypothetical protein [Phytoactinopolyspora halophila]
MTLMLKRAFIRRCGAVLARVGVDVGAVRQKPASARLLSLMRRSVLRGDEFGCLTSTHAAVFGTTK